MAPSTAALVSNTPGGDRVRIRVRIRVRVILSCACGAAGIWLRGDGSAVTTWRVDVEVQVTVTQVAKAAHLCAQRAHPRPHLLDEIVQLAD